MERQNSDSIEFKSGAGTIRNVNISKNKKYKLNNTLSVLLLTSAVLINIFTGCSVKAKTDQKDLEPSVVQEVVLNNKDEYIKVITEVPIEVGDNVSTFAELYYKDDFAREYKDIKEYEQAIIDENGLSKDGLIITGSTLKIPVIVKSDDPYYLRYQEALASLDGFQKIWTSHVVSFGETLWSMAEQSCVEDGDIIETIDQIKEKNGLENSSLDVGMQLLIKNPALKELKQDVIDTRDDFNASLVTGQKVGH